MTLRQFLYISVPAISMSYTIVQNDSIFVKIPNIVLCKLKKYRLGSKTKPVIIVSSSELFDGFFCGSIEDVEVVHVKCHLCLLAHAQL